MRNAIIISYVEVDLEWLVQLFGKKFKTYPVVLSTVHKIDVVLTWKVGKSIVNDLLTVSQITMIFSKNRH